MASLFNMVIPLVFLVSMIPLVVVGSGRILTPDEYLKLKKAYEDRCTPPPDDNTLSRPRPQTVKCDLLHGSVSFKGQCYTLLKQGPCTPTQWLVLDKNTERLICRVQPCPKHHVLVSGGCAVLNSEETNRRHCRKSLQLIINEYGEAECECPVSEVYHPLTGRCYPLFQQGPCKDGDVLQIVDGAHGSYADCLPSLCSAPGQVPMTPRCHLAKPSSLYPLGNINYQCYSLFTAGPCCAQCKLTLDLSLLDVVCEYDEPYGLFDSLPGGRPCSRGSRRDSLGRCTRDLPSSDVSDASTVPPTVKPGQYDNGSVCPDGYVFLSGTCLQIVSGT